MTRRCAPVIVLLGLMSMSAGCAQGTDLGASETGPSVASEDAGTAATRQLMLRTEADINGTPAQRSAAERIVYVTYQDGVQACHGGDGGYVPVDFLDPYAGATTTRMPRDFPAFISLSDTATVENGLAVVDRPVEPDVAATPAPTGDAQTAGAAISDCIGRIAPEGLMEQYRNADLGMAFDAVLREAEGAAQAELDKYPQCMAEHDVPGLKSPRDTPDYLVRQVGSLATEDGHALQDRVASAEKDCLLPAQSLALAALADPLEQFRAEHEVELAESAQRWDGVTVRAQELDERFRELNGD